MRVAIYARYSSDLQEETSIADQIAMCERFCEKNGWTVVARFHDEEMSGRPKDRPGLNALLDEAKAGQFDTVVIEAIDRLTCRLTHRLQSFEVMQFHRVQLHSVTEGPQSFFDVLLRGLGAQQFSEMVAEHTKREQKGAVERHGATHSGALG